jgi:hypothetical protein
MDRALLLEIVGYVASALVAISLMMSSILRLRLINLVGSLAFTIYGALIGAYPVAVVNALIVCINVYYLWQMRNTRQFFQLLRVEPDSEYLIRFLDFYRDEIRRFLPGFAHAPAPGQLAFFTLRDMVPAGLLMGELREDGTLHVLLDFVIPQYRDFKTGRYLFSEQADYLRGLGVREVVSAPGSEVHTQYLRRMGFAPVDAAGADAAYRLPLG